MLDSLESWAQTALALAKRPEAISVVAVAVTMALGFRIMLRGDESPVVFAWKPAHTGEGGREIQGAHILKHKEDCSLLHDGYERDASYITCYSPATGAHLATVPALSKAQIRDAITAAEAAQTMWGKTTFSERRRVLRSLLKWCVDDMAEIAAICSRDTGKTTIDGAFGEILTVAEKLRWTIQHGERILRPSTRSTNAMLVYKKAQVQYEPLGVVAAIVSWNYPYHNLLSPIISSLFSGNAIVVKPSENVAWSSLIFANAVRECLRATGHSPDLVQIAVCLPDAVEALTKDERLGHVTFIGSETVGKKVAMACAEAGTALCLELGGKDPCIVLDSAKIKQYTPTWMRGTFQAGGQNCIGIERFIVGSKVYDEFVDEMAGRVRELKLGDVLAPGPDRVDMGAMISDRLFEELENRIQKAVRQGARLVCGGKRFVHPKYPNGHYFEPTLIVDVTPEMDIAQNELFAPVMTVMKSTSIDDAIEIANGTRYGLGASVFGNPKECTQVADRLKCGMVSTNDFGVFYLSQSLPFGGYKASGYGRFSGEEGLRALCNPKSVIHDRYPSMIQTSIPPPLQYPIKSADKARHFVFGLIQTMYGTDLKKRVEGIKNILKGSF